MIKFKKRIIFLLSVIMMLFTITKRNLYVASSSFICQTGPVVDVYTQKLPYNGEGLNQSSDAFRPDEEVIVYAKVTYNEYPVQNQTVIFTISGPPNEINNISIVLSSETNETGIAEVSFRIPSSIENLEEVVFGEWEILGTTMLADELIVDVLTFLVGWIVEITELQTLNEDLQLETQFPKESEMNINITLNNIAFTSKNVTLTLTIIDANKTVIRLISETTEIPPGKTIILTNYSIPKTVALGQATILANLYILPENFHSPQITFDFYIILLGDLNWDGVVNVKDLAIVALSFGSFEGHLRWDPVADLDKNGVVNIKDIAIVAFNFGAVDP